MADDCILCQIAAGKIPSKKIYEDDEILAVLDFNGANPGHSFVFPKKHFAIFEQVPDFEVGNMFKIANAISSAVFETLNIQGTNLFVTNGVSAGQKIAHFFINVIPRLDNDKVNLNWQAKKLDEEEMSTVELKLKEAAKNIGYFQEKVPSKARTAPQKVETISGKDNYLLKQIRRIP